MSAPRVLLLGGHGKVSQLFTKIALAKAWHVTSVIRDPSQEITITALGSNKPGKVDAFISSVEDVKTTAQAKEIITKTNPNYVVRHA